jgi:hypothetical protein
MKKSNGILLAALFFIVATMSSCDAIAGIFKAGMWTMLIIIVLVIAIIFWLVGKFRK